MGLFHTHVRAWLDSVGFSTQQEFAFPLKQGYLHEKVPFFESIVFAAAIVFPSRSMAGKRSCLSVGSELQRSNKSLLSEALHLIVAVLAQTLPSSSLSRFVLTELQLLGLGTKLGTFFSV